MEYKELKPGPKNTRIQIGECWVDSGQIMLVDPCYLTSWVDDESYDAGYNNDNGPWDFSYNGACNATLSYRHAGQLKNGAVVTSSGYGDGSYPVYATYNGEGRVISLEILFDQEDDEINDWIFSEEDEDNSDI